MTTAPEVLVISQGFSGHLQPSLSIAQELSGAGARVTLAVSRIASSQLPVVPEGLRAEQFGCSIADLLGRGIQRDSFAVALVEAAVPDLIKILEQRAPDLIVFDQSESAAAIVAQQADIPSVSLGCLTLRDADAQAMAAELGDQLGSLARAGRQGVSLHLHPWPPSLAPEAEWMRNSLGVRTIPGASPAARRGNRALVTLGSTPRFAKRQDIWSVLLESMRQQEFMQFLVANLPADLYGLVSSNVRLADSFPFTTFAEVDLVLHAGGSGTSLYALANATPVVSLPLGADHYFNAERLQARGVGLTVDAVGLEPSAVLDATASILAPTYAQNAAEVAYEISRMAAPLVAAETMIDLCTRRQRL